MGTSFTKINKAMVNRLVMEIIFGMLITSWLESLDPPDPSNYPVSAYWVRCSPHPKIAPTKELVVKALEKASKAVEIRQAGNLALAEELSNNAITDLQRRYSPHDLRLEMLIEYSFEVYGALQMQEVLHFKPILDSGRLPPDQRHKDQILCLCGCL
jgi:hypothetical protein